MQQQVECAAMRSRGLFKRVLIAFILTVLALPSSGRADEGQSGRLEAAVYAGFFDTAASSPSAEAGLEVRRSTSIDRLAFLSGIAGNEDGGAWIYGGATGTNFHSITTAGAADAQSAVALYRHCPGVTAEMLWCDLWWFPERQTYLPSAPCAAR